MLFFFFIKEKSPTFVTSVNTQLTVEGTYTSTKSTNTIPSNSRVNNVSTKPTLSHG